MGVLSLLDEVVVDAAVGNEFVVCFPVTGSVAGGWLGLVWVEEVGSVVPGAGDVLPDVPVDFEEF